MREKLLRAYQDEILAIPACLGLLDRKVEKEGSNTACRLSPLLRNFKR